MKENRVRTLMTAGKPAINGWLMVPSTLSAELMAKCGFDSLTIDMQHGMIDLGDALEMLTAVSATAATPIVRVPWLEPGTIMKILDAGAYGIICPMISTREQAETFVAATKYAPMGNRSWGPVRASIYAGSDYLQHANDTILNLAMIETAEAVGNLEEICSVKGLDAIYVGPGDLNLTLSGSPRADTMEGEVGKAIQKILTVAKAHKIFACTHTSSPQFAVKMLEMGFDFVTVANDSQILTAGGTSAVEHMRAAKLR